MNVKATVGGVSNRCGGRQSRWACDRKLTELREHGHVVSDEVFVSLEDGDGLLLGASDVGLEWRGNVQGGRSSAMRAFRIDHDTPSRAQTWSVWSARKRERQETDLLPRARPPAAPVLDEQMARAHALRPNASAAAAGCVCALDRSEVVGSGQVLDLGRRERGRGLPDGRRGRGRVEVGQSAGL